LVTTPSSSSEFPSSHFDGTSSICGGRYELCELVGRGPLGLVYRAVDQELGRPVAIKCIFDIGLSDLRARVLAEAKALAALNHQHVAKIYDVLSDDDRVFIITEWFDGQHLADLTLPLTPSVGIALMIQVYEGIAAAHQVELPHRGLSVDQVLIGPQGQVKLIGFGGAWQRIIPNGSRGTKQPRVSERSERSAPNSGGQLVCAVKADLNAAEQLMRSIGATLLGGAGSSAAVMAKDLRVLLATLTDEDPATHIRRNLQANQSSNQSRNRDSLPRRATGVDQPLLPPDRLMVGNSRGLLAVYQLLTRLAPVNVATLIIGETGTGKELVAREIHRLSPRADGPLITVNAVAMPADLVESELFGHRRGAFTGALNDREGLIERADGGTLFLDEIGELSPQVQAKLLRVLQERSFTRIGENTIRKSDFRLVAATHRNLQELIASGQFREDFYYRIAAATIQMPPLRERREDIVPLVLHFHRRFAEEHGLKLKRWSMSALQLLTDLAWPGNIRELEHCVRRALVMCDGPIVQPNHLDTNITVDSNVADESQTSNQPTLDEARNAWMRRFLQRALAQHNGRRGDTAKALGIGERTLFRYIEQFGIS